MTVRELIRELEKTDFDAKVFAYLYEDKDTSMKREITLVEDYENRVHLSNW